MRKKIYESTKQYKLYEVTQDIEDLIDNTDSDDEYFNDTMEALQLTFDEKASGVSAYIGNLEAMAESIKKAEKNMADRRKSILKNIERLKKYLLDNMERLNIDKIETEYFIAKIKKNPPKVVINNEDDVPEEYWEKQVKWIINKTKIKKALKSDKKINIKGAEIKQEKRLEIK